MFLLGKKNIKSFYKYYPTASSPAIYVKFILSKKFERVLEKCQISYFYVNRSEYEFLQSKKL